MASLLSTILLIVSVLALPDCTLCQSSDLTPICEITLEEDDLNYVKSSVLCTTRGACFLSNLPGAFADALGLTGVSGIVQVTELINDTTSPSLVQFKSFSVSDGIIVLDYDEVIDLQYVNLSGVTLQSSFENIGNVLPLQSGEILNVDDEYSTEVILQINNEDLNMLKRDGDICIVAGQCWIRYPNSFLRDARDNPVEQVVDGSSNTAERAVQIIPDTDPPNLINFSVVVDENRISLTFDETIATATIDFTKISFSGGPNDTDISYTLTDGTLLSVADSDFVDFTLDPVDIIELKAQDSLFSSTDDTYITFTADFIEDQFTNAINSRVLNNNALQAANFSNDTVHPTVVRFDLINLDTNVIQVSFNEPVDIDTINISRFAIAAGPEDGAVIYYLTGYSNIRYVTTNRLTIEIGISDVDIRAIKLNSVLATNVTTSYLDVYGGAIDDTAGIPNAALVDRLMVLEHVEDSRGPMLVSFSLNLTSNTIDLTFDDTVRVGTLDPTKITLQSDATGTGVLYTLTGGDSISPDDYDFTLELSQTDINAIKSMPELATDRNNTYMSITAEALRDVFSARIVPTVQSEALQAQFVIPDIIHPQLTSFNLNYNTELLTLTFDEIVQVLTFDVTQISIQNTLTLEPNVTTTLTLTGGIASSDSYVTSFAVELTREDLNNLKVDTSIAVGYTSTYLTITEYLIVDSNDNEVVEILADAALNVTMFSADQTPPILTAFDLDMNVGQIIFTFDEVVNATSFNAVGIQLQNNRIPSTYYRLTDGNVSTENQPVITVDISEYDLNEIKRNFNLATSDDNTYVTLSPITVSDMNEVSFDNVSAVQVTTFTNDSTRPELVSFTLDLNLGFINLTFSETVDSTSLMVQYVTLLAESGTNDTSLQHTLYNTPRPYGSYTDSVNSTQIDIILGIDDLNEIKRLVGLGTTRNNTYIAIEPELIIDMNGNLVQEISATDPKQVLYVEDDVTMPELVSFSFDMNTGCLNLTFSETVNASSLNISSIIFQNGNNSFFALSHTLRSSQGQDDDAVIIAVKLSDEDLNLLKFQVNLASLPTNTYLRLSSDAIFDMSSNRYVEASDSFNVSVFTPDIDPPSLDVFSLDLDTGILSLTFTEVINDTSLNLTAISLQSSTMMPFSSFTLTGGEKTGSNIDTGHPPVIDITLTIQDLNTIKQLDQLATSNDTTFLSIESNAAVDLAPRMNVLLPVDGDQVDQYYMDMTEPQLVEFYIDLTEEILTLVFDETVESTSLNISQITLQSSRNLSAEGTSYTLMDSTLNTTQDDTVLQVKLNTVDLNTIKLNRDLCTDETNCYISLPQDTLQDMNENYIQEIPIYNASITANYTEDMTFPELDSFKLDMDEGVLTLTFTEPIDIDTLQIDRFILHEMVDDDMNNTIEQLISGILPEQSETNSSNGVEIVIILGTENVYSIQRKLDLAKDQDSTYISIDVDAVRDMNNLSVVPIFPNMSQRAMEYVVDSTPPVLLEYLLDVNQGLLSLTFDETVDASEIAINMFMILSTNDTMISDLPPLSSSTIQPVYDDPIINITLTEGDLNALKLLVNLGTDPMNTYLYIPAGRIVDTSINNDGNGIAETVQQAADVIDDETHPIALGFEVNLNYGYIVISFNEPINASSIEYTEITLQNRAENFTANYTLTNGTNPGIDRLSIMINFTDDDLNTVKQMVSLFVSLETSFLSFTPNAISDMASNPVVPRPNSDALPATTYINDTINPMLLYFDLDMNLGYIDLIFTETVNVSSIQFDAIILQSSRNTTSINDSYTLTGGTLRSNISDTTVFIELETTDLNELKRLEIGLTEPTSYIVLSSELILDMNDNPVRSVENDIAEEVMMYTPDTTPPQLDNFALNLTSELLTLTFSETVRRLSFDVTALTLQDMTNATSYTLTSSSNSNSADGTIIEVILGRQDLNQIKLDTDLATSMFNTYISITSAAIRDMFGIPVQNHSDTSSLQAYNFTEDSKNPELEGFTLDLDEGDLILSFSETVNASTLNVSTITLQNSQNYSEPTSFVPLSEIRVDENGPTIYVPLLTADLNEIKRLLDLGNDENDTFLTIHSSGVQDMNENYVETITRDMALPAELVIPDDVRPELAGFSLNLNNSQLMLSFSETVSVPSLILSGIILQNAENSTTMYALTDTSMTQIENSSIVIVFLSVSDANAIKEDYMLAVDNFTTFLRLEANSIHDMNNNYILEISDGNATEVDVFTPDLISPELDSFDLDMDEGILLLTFNEPVNIDTFNFTSLTITNSSLLTGEMYQLTSGYPSMRNYTNVNITLTQFDLNNIKVLLDLATDENNTYLVFEQAFVRDMNENFINNDSIVPVTELIPDRTSPQLISFELNLNNNTLVLNFSEAVSAVTFQASSVTLQETSEGGANRTLSDSYVVSPLIDSTVITVHLSTNDVNEITRLPFATTVNDTYISILPTAINDTNMNMVELVPDTDAIGASDYISDEVNPSFERFDFNVSSGEIVLYFSETINASTLNVTGFALQNKNTTDFLQGYYRLTDVSTSSSENYNFLVIFIHNDDLNLIKADFTLAVDNFTTHISMDNGSVLDMAGNPLNAISPQMAIQVDMFTEDFVQPVLTNFSLYFESTQLILELVFYETVNAITLDPTKITFSNEENASNLNHTFRLTGGNVSLENSTIVTINITADDLREIRLLDVVGLFTTPNTSYLAIDADAVEDMVGNTNVPIPISDAQQITGTNADLLPPTLLSAVFDLNMGLLTLQFSEPVEYLSFNATKLTLQSVENASMLDHESYTLTGYSLVEPGNSGSIVEVLITMTDLNAIKRLTQLAVSESTTYIAFLRGLVVDYALNEAVLTPTTDALGASFIQDITGPTLIGFNISMTEELINLTFSETINSSSVDITKFIFQNRNRAAASSYTLVNSVVVSNDSTLLSVSFSFSDINNIKAIEDLLTDEVDTYIAIDREGLMDMAGNELIEVFTFNARDVDVFLPDVVVPEMVNYTLDMDDGELLLTFTETVQERSLDVTQLTFQSNYSIPATQYNITAAISNSDSSFILSITTSLYDVNNIKALPSLCTTQDDCYLSFTTDLIMDMVGLPIIPVSQTNAVQGAYIPDTTGPRLEGFIELNYLTNTLTLQLSETVNVNTLNFSALTLQSLFTNPILPTVTLIGGEVPLINTSLLIISLTDEDLDTLKNNPFTCTYRGNCYVTFTSDFVEDMGRTAAQPTGSTFPGFLVQSLIDDDRQPTLLYFDLNMENETLVLGFDEAIDFDEIDVTQITLQGSQNATSEMQFTLTGGTIVMLDPRTILIVFDAMDIEGMKASMYFKNESTSYLSLMTTAVRDLAFIPNFVVSIPTYNATGVRNFTRDRDGPLLLAFLLDYDLNQLILDFNEPVLPQTLNFSGITIHSEPSGGYNYTLTGGDVVNDDDSGDGFQQLVINLNDYDVIELQSSDVLATNMNDTYLTLANFSVFDGSGDQNMLITLQGDITVDNTPAQLDSFTFDEDLGLINFTFTDVVLTATFSPDGVTIQDARMSDPSLQYTLTEGSTTIDNRNGFTITVRLSETDLNTIKLNPLLATNESNTYMTMRASTLDDVFGNDILAVTNGKAIMASQVIRDDTNPYLEMYNLDLNEGLIELNFSETINVSTIDPSKFRLQRSDNDTDAALTLDGNSTVILVNPYQIIIQLTEDDLNRLKQLEDVGTTESNTYLTILSDAGKDFSENVIDSSTLQVTRVLPDVKNPELLSFDLDLNTGLLYLEFSETMNASSLDVTQLLFQGVQLYRTGDRYYLTTSEVQLTNAPRLIVNISMDDLNVLKQLPLVATNPDDTYLVIDTTTVRDMATNPVIAIRDVNAQRVNEYIPDTTNPSLIGFNLNLTTDELTLFFDETVASASFDVTQITLHNSFSMDASRTLTGGIIGIDDSPIIVVTMTTADLNYIKQDDSFATDMNNTYLTLTNFTAEDTALPEPNPVNAVTEAVPVFAFDDDQISPELVSFSFDAHLGVITLSFSETVRVSTLNSTFITLQNGRENYMEYQLTGGYSNSSDGNVIMVQLNDFDQNAIKSIADFVTDDGNTFVRITSDLIMDMNDNQIVDIPSSQAIQVTDYIIDMNKPEFESFYLNLNTSQLFLTFTETVDASTVQFPNWTIQNSRDNPTAQVQLQTGSVSSDDSIHVVLTLSRSDTNRLKVIESLATDVDNTFISITEGAILDTSGNTVMAIPITNAINATMVIPDEISPVLEYFTLDMDEGLLHLSFDEIVRVMTTNFTFIVLQNIRNTSTIYELMDGSIITNNSDVITIELTTEDTNNIKQIRDLAKSINDSYLSIDMYAIEDMYNNSLVPIENEQAIQAQVYVPDTTDPQLISFDLDMDEGQLHFYFDETVDAIRINPRRLVIVANLTTYDLYYNITGGTRSMVDSPNITVFLTPDDLNTLKLDRNISTMSNDTALTAGISPDDRDLFVRDTALIPNYLQIVSLNVNEFIPDTTPPMLTMYYVDIDQFMLVLMFNEVVESDSVYPPAITLQSSPNITDGSFYTLTNGSTTSPDGLQIIIILTEIDLNNIKQMPNLLIDQSTTYLSFTEDLLDDMNYNNVTAIPMYSAEQASFYFNDSTRPRLRTYYLDMDNGNLTLVFPETINASSVDVTSIGIQIHLNTSNSTRTYRLTDSTVVSTDSPVVEIEISSTDLNELKRREIAYNAARTYLTLTNTTLHDTFDHYVVPLINAVSATRVLNERYIPDSTGPYFQSFDIDLTEETLTLRFDETVRPVTFDATQLVLQNNSNAALTFYNLTDSSTIIDIPLQNVTIQLGLEDLNNIKRFRALATDDNDTYISFSRLLITDMTGNSVQMIPDTNATQVNEFMGDFVDPRLIGFDINLTNDSLTIYFSETVDVTTLNTTQITFQNTATNGSDTACVQLTGGDSAFTDDPTVVVTLLNDDLNKVKQFIYLATSVNDTFISITNLTISDMNGNPVVSISKNNATMATNYYGDFVRPSLERWDLDMDASTLTLYFSETANSLTLNVTAIILQDGMPADDFYRLTDGDTESINDTVIVVNITQTDLNELKKNTSLVTSEDDSYLSIEYTLIQDMNGNYVIPIDNENVYRVRNHTNDTTSPELLSYNLDMNIGQISFTFSETVNAYSFNPSLLVLQPNISVAGAQRYRLMGGNSTEENSTVIVMDILRDLEETPDDLNELKFRPYLVTEESNTYLSFTPQLVQDMNFNYIVPLPNAQAQRVLNYTTDVTPPYLHAFDIDMNNGVLILTFDETLSRESLNVEEFTLIANSSFMVERNITINETLGTIVLANVTFPLPNVTLNGGFVVPGDSQVIRIELTFDDLNRVKRLDLCTERVQQDNCYIAFTTEAVKDMANNTIVPVNITMPRKARNYTSDINPPYLTQFVQFSFVDNTVILNFNETINVTSFDPTQITIQRWGFYEPPDPFPRITLTGSENITEVNDTTVQFTITVFDMNRIKSEQPNQLCEFPTNCIVRFTNSVVADMAMNLAAPLRDDRSFVDIFEYPLIYFPDEQQPILETFDIDMNSGNVTLTFDETVDYTDFLSTPITLFNADVNATEQYSLESGVTVLTDDYWIYISFLLTENDLCELKYRELLAVSNESTYLENTAMLIEDMYGNDASIHDASNRLMVGDYIRDTTRPNLTDFEIDLENKLLTLTSNEPIYLPSVQPSFLTLQSSENIDTPGSSNYTLTNGTVFYDQPDVYLKKRVTIMMTLEDLLVIQLDTALAINSATTYLSILDGAFKDTFLNDVHAISNQTALNTIDHDPNSIGPDLVSFTLDMDLGIIDMAFDDVIKTMTFVATSVTLQNAEDPSDVTAKHTLSTSMTNSSDGYTMRIYLSDVDFNTIKYIRTLATSINNTFLVTNDDVNRPFLLDTSNNQVMDRVIGLMAANFTEDTSRPHLVKFDLSMNYGYLRLTFNETVMASSLSITNLILGNTANFTDAEHVFPISGGDSSQNDSTVLYVYFSIDDFNELKRITPGIATSTMDTYLAFDNDTLIDMNNNSVVEIDTESARMVTGFDPDSTNPNLTSFNLNLTSEILELTFDETVDASTFDVTGITLVSSTNFTFIAYTLNRGEHTQNDSTVIIVQLDIDDLNEIKWLRDLAVSINSTYIMVESHLIDDMNRNDINIIEQENALQVTLFEEDYVLPELVSFDLDLNADLLSLTFFETVQVDTLNITYLTFISGINMFGNETQYTLTGGMPTTNDSTVLNITLNKIDSDFIRFYDDLATNENNTFLILDTYAIQDMNANPINYTAIQVTNFTEDRVNPILMLFNLDVNTGILTLRFSETMNTATLDATQITFHDNANGFSNHILTGGYTLYDDNNTVYLQISDTDLNELKRQLPLITAENYTFISLTNNTIEDMNGNPLIPAESEMN
ncbi:uncharacterized protein [Dysidea avara]|uniref:uncharacterized protein n=1 Tax=Dysidea avara TaxID=196820 RepID=UPI003320FD0F